MPNFRVDFFQKKIERDFSYKIHPFAEKRKKIRGVSLVKLKIFFIDISLRKLKVSSIFWLIFFWHFKGNFYMKLYGYWKNGASGIRPRLQTFFSYVLTTWINERLIRKFNYTNVHVNIWTVDGGWCSTFWFFKSLDNNSIYTQDIYSYIFVAQAVILTVKRSLKRRKKSR